MGKSKKRRRSEDDERHLRKKLAKIQAKLARTTSTERSIVADGREVMGTAQIATQEIGPEDLCMGLSGDQTGEDNDENADPSPNRELQGPVVVPVVSQTQTEENLTETQPPKLDEEVLRALGTSAKAQQEKIKLHPDLTALLVDWTTTDHMKDLKETLLSRYPRLIEDCWVEAPKLNPEIAATSAEQIIKRDNHFVENQNIAGSTIVALATTLNILLTEEEEVDRVNLIEKLGDAAKLVSQLHHNFSVARRAFISPTVNKECRVTLEESKPDVLLYGQGLSEKIKSARSIAKMGQDLKIKTLTTRPNNRSVNWKSPFARQSRTTQMGDRASTSAKIPFRKPNRGSGYQSTPNQGSYSRGQGRQQTQGQPSYRQNTQMRR